MTFIGSVRLGEMTDASVRHHLDQASGGLDENVRCASANGFPGEHRTSVIVLDSNGREGAGFEWQRPHGGGDALWVGPWFHWFGWLEGWFLTFGIFGIIGTGAG